MSTRTRARAAVSEIADSSAPGRRMLKASTAQAQADLLPPVSPGYQGMVPIASGVTTDVLLGTGLWGSVPTVGNWFSTRGAAQSATIPAIVLEIHVLHARMWLTYRRDSSGTALISSGSVGWSPATAPLPEHWGAVGDQTTDDATAIQGWLTWLCNSRDFESGPSVKLYGIGSTVIVGNTGSGFRRRIKGLRLQALSALGANPMLDVRGGRVAIEGCTFLCQHISNAVTFSSEVGYSLKNNLIEDPVGNGVQVIEASTGSKPVDFECIGNFFRESTPSASTATALKVYTSDAIVTGNIVSGFLIGMVFRWGGHEIHDNHLYAGVNGSSPETTVMRDGIILQQGDVNVSGNYFDKCRLRIANGYYAGASVFEPATEKHPITIVANRFFTDANHSLSDHFIQVDLYSGVASYVLRGLLIKDNQFRNLKSTAGNAPNLKPLAFVGSGPLTSVEQCLMYDNISNLDIKQATRGRSKITLPSGTTSVTSQVTTAVNPFGDFDCILANIISNPGKILRTVTNTPATATYDFVVDTSHGSNLTIFAEVSSSVEF